MDQDHGTATRDRGHFLEHLALLGDGRPTELDDEDLAHVVYSEFSITYVSVRSQPKASPRPVPEAEVEPDDELRPVHRPARRRAIELDRAAQRSVEHDVAGDRDPERGRVERGRGAGTGPSRPWRTGRPASSTAATASRAFPAAPAMRPQFGSRPWAAALTRLDETTARATARASASSLAPVTIAP